MNVEISMNTAEVQENIKTRLETIIENLTAELNSMFRGKINTPEKVISVYEKLEQYKQLSGKDYKITCEENTIV